MAIASPDAGPDAANAPVAPTRRRRPWLGSRRRQLVAALILAGTLSYILYQGLTNATQFFKTANQAVADKAQLGTTPFRIEGTVEHNVRQIGPDTDFSIYANGVAVAVVATQQPSQLFQPGIPVVLEGHWQGNTYLANQIMVKHTASYTEAHPNRLKSQLPRGPSGPAAQPPGAAQQRPNGPASQTPGAAQQRPSGPAAQPPGAAQQSP